ncbi:MAG: sigma 54-interacting transcriptional regulator [Opitutales bacterium]
MPENPTQLSPAERTFLKSIASLIYCNPFSSTRKEIEEDILKTAYLSPSGDHEGKFDNVSTIQGILKTQLYETLKHIESSRSPLPQPDFELYEQGVWFYVFHKYANDFDQYIRKAHLRGNGRTRAPFLIRLWDDLDRFLQPIGVPQQATLHNEHLIAVFFQVRRAFYHIHQSIFGNSEQTRALRARTWESIFTHNFYRYQTRLYERMGDIITLITGPSGTGKELIARAIGLSRFIPYDPTTALFEEDFLVSFFPLNLSALSETLIESELFGHRKGAFTGAQTEKKGYFESCGVHGTVFLDEIGETNTSIQVKLLRVLQTRQFQRLGGTDTLQFEGKVITATNRNLEEEIKKGNFREDFFFRICSDQLETSGLREILQEKPDELPNLVSFIAKRLLGEGSISEQLTDEAVDWIRKEVPPSYPWPGNFRELEQCVRNIMVHGEYKIKKELVFKNAIQDGPNLPDYVEDFLKGNLSYESLLHHYFKISVNREGGFAQSARAIGVDQRTVKKYYELKLEK